MYRRDPLLPVIGRCQLSLLLSPFSLFKQQPSDSSSLHLLFSIYYGWSRLHFPSPLDSLRLLNTQPTPPSICTPFPPLLSSPLFPFLQRALFFFTGKAQSRAQEDPPLTPS